MTEVILNWGQNQLEMGVHEYFYIRNGSYHSDRVKISFAFAALL